MKSLRGSKQCRNNVVIALRGNKPSNDATFFDNSQAPTAAGGCRMAAMLNVTVMLTSAEWMKLQEYANRRRHLGQVQ
jgi:hypothetical protein